MWNYNTEKLKNAWPLLLLIIRFWLGYKMISAGYSSVVDIIFHPEERAFFEDWFGKELHFPFPLVMAFIAKFTELCGGILVMFGLFTRVGALGIAVTMMVATLTANLGEDFNIDGGFTISFSLFALICVIWGGGKFSLDNLISAKNNKH